MRLPFTQGDFRRPNHKYTSITKRSAFVYIFYENKILQNLKMSYTYVSALACKSRLYIFSALSRWCKYMICDVKMLLTTGSDSPVSTSSSKQSSSGIWGQAGVRGAGQLGGLGQIEGLEL